MENNIVEYFAEHEGYRCGYCKSNDTNFSHGMWAHRLRPEEYESLLDRGWRRSGKYLYKPTNDKTCCPCYTIKFHALDFRISKSQKKVLKKFNDFLATGKINQRAPWGATGGTSNQNAGNSEYVKEVINYHEATATNVTILEQTNLPLSYDTAKCEEDNTPKDLPPESPFLDSPKRRKSDFEAPQESVPSHPQPQHREKKGQKAKFLRLERRKQKLLAKGLSLEEVLAKTKKTAPQPKEIEEFLRIPPNAKLKLEIRSVKTDTKEFEATFDLEHALYKKYQMKIHSDEEDELTPKKFRRFLIDNPLNEAAESAIGCYHQQYYLGTQLIAVGVVDILPKCLSSVYFFYDPDFMNLTLGTYGALQEIGYIRERTKSQPDFRFYYMGFYIHSCTKMRYKGSFNPSYLLCPETHKWKVLDDELRDKLNKAKYTPFYPSKLKEQENIAKVSILYRMSIMPYRIYEFKRARDDTNEIQEYCDLVGGEIANRLCLYRSPPS